MGVHDCPRSNWSWGVADFFLDWNPLPRGRQGLQIDIQSEKDWDKVLQHVAKHGKFNFSICSHTLEDLPNPRPVLRHLRHISLEGFIAVPTKFVELQRNFDEIAS